MTEDLNPLAPATVVEELEREDPRGAPEREKTWVVEGGLVVEPEDEERLLVTTPSAPLEDDASPVDEDEDGNPRPILPIPDEAASGGPEFAATGGGLRLGRRPDDILSSIACSFANLSLVSCALDGAAPAPAVDDEDEAEAETEERPPVTEPARGIPRNVVAVPERVLAATGATTGAGADDGGGRGIVAPARPRYLDFSVEFLAAAAVVDGAVGATTEEEEGGRGKEPSGRCLMGDRSSSIDSRLFVPAVERLSGGTAAVDNDDEGGRDEFEARTEKMPVPRNLDEGMSSPSSIMASSEGESVRRSGLGLRRGMSVGMVASLIGLTRRGEMIIVPKTLPRGLGTRKGDRWTIGGLPGGVVESASPAFE